ncbi:MAG: hypothetical protein LQ342_003843 [Letrouitia transgressa]|nr:MAG: hypothetical protein LQ342_003843 [Letrouitia transgressa]
MPTFIRNCCRFQRTVSPGLPNAQPVASNPAQDDDYDADAAPISTPNITLGPNVVRLLADPRPSTDTVIHYEAPRASTKTSSREQEPRPEPTASSAEIPPENSADVEVPSRGSHSQSPRLLSALDAYVRLTPSRAALRRRIKAIKDIAEPTSPFSADPSAHLRPLPSNSPDPGVVRCLRLPGAEGEDKNDRRRPSLAQIEWNEAKEQTKENCREPVLSSPPRVRENAPTELDGHGKRDSGDDGRVRGQENGGVSSAVSATGLLRIRRRRKHGRSTFEAYPMPGSYQSDSTGPSVHLYDMQISERLASNHLSFSSSSAQIRFSPGRERANTTGSSSLFLSSRSRSRAHSSEKDLQSPKPPSSLYGSNEQSLASSRRSSILFLQSLPERLNRLKSHQASGDLQSASEEPSKISVAPWRGMRATEAEGPKQETAEDVGLKTHHKGIGELPSSRVLSSPLRRASTEPALKEIRDGIKSFDGSGEWHLSPEQTRTGNAYLFSQDATSVWERALQEYRAEDRRLSQTRFGSFSHGIGRDDFKRQARRRSRRFTRTPSALREDSVWTSEGKDSKEPASGKVSPTGGVSPTRNAPSSPNIASSSKRITPPAPVHRSDTVSDSSRSVESWLRYPSHTFAERTGPAGPKDNVTPRDFADALAPERRISKKKSRSMTFPKKVIHRIGRVYKTRSVDFRRFKTGHRSSIAVGGRLEYPELEIPPPVFGSAFRLDKLRTECQEALAEPAEVEGAASASQRRSPEPGVSKGKGVAWARDYYNDCVYQPRNTDEEEVHGGGVVKSEDDLRSSTLEYEKALRGEEARAREEALEAADKVYRSSLEIER